MSKINFSFNGKDYSFEESSLVIASTKIKSALTSTMSGSGASVVFDGTTYNVDSTKLSDAVGEFTSSLAEISEESGDAKVVIKGTEYPVSSNTIANAVSDLHKDFNKIINSGVVYSEGLVYTAHPQLDGVYVSGIGTCEDSVIVVPLVSSDGAAVIGIGPQAFKNNTKITSVVFHENMTVLGNYAFQGCTSLTSIEVASNNPKYISINGNLHTKDDNSFVVYPAGKKEASFTIPENTAKISNCAFCSCVNLENVEIPNSVTSIGTSAFNGCSNLIAVKIPNSVVSISNQAFAYCSSLTSIEIGDSVTSIGEAVFQDCTSLTNIKIPNNTTSLGSQAFRNCINLSNVVISNNIETINTGLFYGCTSLSRLVIPGSVKTIGEYAFYNCSAFSSVYYAGSEEDWGTISIGNNNSALTSAARYYYSESDPNRVGNFWYYDENGEVSIWPPHEHVYTETTIDPTCTTNGQNIYTCSCGYTHTQTIPAKGHTPGSIVSEGRIEATCTNDGYYYKRQYCTVCETRVLNQRVTLTKKGHNYVDRQCTKCGAWDTAGCSSGLTYTSNEDGTYSVSGIGTCTDTDLVIPPTYSGKLVTGISDKAFENLNGSNGKHKITSVEIPKSVKSIGREAFRSCSKLESVTIPNSVTSIDYSAFSSTGITSIYIPGSVVSIGNYAFSYCLELGSIVFGDGITNIGEWFVNCSKVTSITIPKSVTSIAAYTAFGFDSLTDVYYAGSEADWAKINIGSSNSKLTSATKHFNYTG